MGKDLGEVTRVTTSYPRFVRHILSSTADGAEYLKPRAEWVEMGSLKALSPQGLMPIHTLAAPVCTRSVYAKSGWAKRRLSSAELVCAC
jgi:hypothetical protein